MLDKGFIRESSSPAAVPLLLAAKPGGGVRICQDYRGLNNITVKNCYPLPMIRETLDSLCGAKFYTKLDVIAAFNRIRIAQDHEWKTAVITRFGLYETLVTPLRPLQCPRNLPELHQPHSTRYLRRLLYRVPGRRPSLLANSCGPQATCR